MSSLKKQFCAIFISVCITGCSSIQSNSFATPNKASSNYEKEEPSKGFENFLEILGYTLFVGVIFAVAPKEAYR